MRARISVVLVCAISFGCGQDPGVEEEGTGAVPPPSCSPAATGGATVAAPRLAYTLSDRWHEAWLASPAVADLDGDGVVEIVAPRDELLIAWHADNTIAWKATLPGRIWSSPVVADLLPSRPGLEVAVASRGQIVAYDATGHVLPGFPFQWRDELRSLAAADLDGTGGLELVAVTSSPLAAGGQRDVVIAIDGSGAIVGGFPPNTTGTSGCDDACYVTGGYDENLALGDVDGDGRADIFVTQDNAYMSLHDGTGRAFDAAPIFRGRTKFSGIRWMVDYDLAQQGYANDESRDEQAHFTNTAPTIADLDGDGSPELISLGSIQNAAQTDRERGVGLFVARCDGTRPDAWITPPRFPDYRGGLWDGGDNIVGITNQVTVANIDPGHPGPELVFAGFDGRIHAVDARGTKLWTRTYTGASDVWTAGIVAADLSGDGSPELVFTTYGPSGGDLIILDAGGNIQHRIPLGGRGAMPVPTIADADGDGDLDIIVSLKDAVDRERSVLVFDVPGSSANCLLWPTGRGNFRRDGYLPPR
ncbi:MAG TPA: PQQ-binding-like beta-propeller repeat protein [Kofleriaceae bacterium]|nr:PQQ-binding-like beta-propeller repeat protein [Kofleriaceae bacterium]